MNPLIRPTDMRIVETQLHFLPVQTRMPLKFGHESLSSVTCARAKITVENRQGHRATGWGETPLSVQWVWPSDLPYEYRHQCLKSFAQKIADQLPLLDLTGHAFEIGHDLIEIGLPKWQAEFAAQKPNTQSHTNVTSIHSPPEPDSELPHLAALVVASVFDQAIHDAFGNLNQIDIYRTYGRDFLPRPLSDFFTGAAQRSLFQDRFLDEFLIHGPPSTLPVWHLVGGLDPLTQDQIRPEHPTDGHPVLLRDWIRRDGIRCLKIKLQGNNSTWDYQRLVDIGTIAQTEGATHLSADFNCTVSEPDYVNEILDHLKRDHPAIWNQLLYVEQPFGYELAQHRIDVRSVANRKPIFLDESAHDWRQVQLGHQLGWTGVALKTCKTQTGALLSLCWAKMHQMPLMVQDLTNPMLAQIPHVRLAAHAGTIMGVESNAMQFYPDASSCEAKIHPGLYQRREGVLKLDTFGETGFGYRIDEIHRALPAPQTLD